MKKTFTLLPLLMVLSTSDSSAQNYQPINSHSLQVFYQRSAYNWMASANMWGTRIDSISVSGQDTLYYNYPIVRDTSLENPLPEYSCVYWNAPNWNGAVTGILQSGQAWFSNELGDSVKIDHSLLPNQNWLAYQYPNGDSLIGTVESIQIIEDDWVTDSVKTISFKHISLGEIVPDPINFITIELFKDHGFRKMVDFLKFPFDTNAIRQVDPNSINVYAPGYIVGNGTIRGVPHEGDGFFKIWRYDHNPPGNNCYHVETTKTSELITSVSTPDQNGSIQVECITNHQSLNSMTTDYGNDCGPPLIETASSVTSNQITRTYTPVTGNYETLIQFENRNLMPREKNAAYSYSPSNPDNICQFAFVDICSCNPIVNWDSNNVEDSCFVVEHPYHFPYLRNQTFVPKYGWWSDEENWYYEMLGDGPNKSTHYTYLKFDECVFGEYAMVGIEENQRPEFSIYPNPTNGVFQMQLSNWNGAKDLSVTVYDMLGRTVENLNPQTSTIEIDASAWPNGVYSVSLVNERGVRHTERLVVQH
ncbi:MAG: T9SS type A sorting domain-containing protein [Flavobacteriales bacterium]|nr:T9SS type A sorting domain-containing protein [Flavobacteriales bacterium]